MENVRADRGARGGEVLRWRLLLAFVGLSLFPLFVSNAIGYLRSRSITDALVERYLDGVASLQAEQIQERLDQRTLYLQAIASGNRFLQAAAERGSLVANPAMSAAAEPAAVRDYLVRKLEESERFDAFAFFSAAGELIASSHGSHMVNRSNAALAEAVTLLENPDPALAPVLRFSASIEGADGTAIAFLAATVPLERGQEFLEIPEHIAGTIESFILDERDYPLFVSHPHGHVEYDRPLASPQVRLPPGANARYRDREGIEVIGASALLPRYDWVFVAEVPAADAAAELHALRSLSLVIGGGFSVLVIGVGWFLAAGIVAPVRRLVSATRRLASGDLGARVPSEGDDEIAELSVAFNDMAEELEANQARIERLHRKEIERAEQLATVGELASGLAHEIKNPVVGISNGLDLIARRVELDASMQPIAAEMKHQLGRIEQAVRDLLAYARPPEPKLSATDLNDVVKRAVTITEPGAQQRGIRIVAELDANLPECAVDRDLIGQAVVNIVLNAVQFSAEGGVVIIRTMHEGTWVRIEVADRGPGIPEEVSRQLFKPFFTTRHSGTGLGLSITRGIAERHGGRIEVMTAAGAGSTFSIVLPVARILKDGKESDE